MPFELRPAIRENVPLLIGLAGSSGSGKTYSALVLAKGLAADSPIAVIDTESGRSKAYADDFKFDVGELTPPFRPQAYEDAIVAVDKLRKYAVIVVDSASHEWAGEGGILDWQEEVLDQMAGADFHKREACKMASWIKPKMAHKQYVNKLLQLRSHLILCFRAEPKTEMIKQDGKWVVQPKHGFIGQDGWFPITEKNMPFELTLYFLLQAEDPGVPHPIKLMAQHRPYFDLTRPISEDNGKRLAEWARGAKQARTLTDDEVKDLELGITEAQTEEELKNLGKRCRLAPAYDQDRLRTLYIQSLEKLRKLA